MATGFSQRFKGRIATAWNGIWMGGAQGVIVFTNAGAPSNGTSGTLAALANPGALLIDTTNKALYQNTNTLASPTWTAAPLTGVASVTSGTIDGTTVGASVPSTGSFTYVDESIAISLAAVGTNRATALALTSQLNVIATAASSAVGVVLPASASVGVGGRVVVYNDGPSNAFHVYAAGSDTIDGTAGATGVVLTNGNSCTYLLGSAGAFLSYRSTITRSA